jgi:hypothetical protein
MLMAEDYVTAKKKPNLIQQANSLSAHFFYESNEGEREKIIKKSKFFEVLVFFVCTAS